MPKIKSKVYIGKNGVGKSKVLEEIYNKQNPRYCFITCFSNNLNAPDTVDQNLWKATFFQSFKLILDTNFHNQRIVYSEKNKDFVAKNYGYPAEKFREELSKLKKDLLKWRQIQDCITANKKIEGFPQKAIHLIFE